MIARIWRGVTREADKDTYFEYLQETGLKQYASAPGQSRCLGLTPSLRRPRRVHLDLALGVLGCDQGLCWCGLRKGRLLSQDEKFLLEMRPKVEHYEILSSPSR
jgi:hypothetical protein